MCIYRGLLGPDWLTLCESVTRAHFPGVAVRGSGVFRITHGKALFSRITARLLRLPLEGDDVPTTLAITPQADGELWERTFGTGRLRTRQYDCAGILAERFGLLELRFRLRAEEGGLTYVQAGAYLRMGPISMRMPNRLAPRVRAREEASGDQTHILVEVDLPMIGRLISYEGCLTIEGDM